MRDFLAKKIASALQLLPRKNGPRCGIPCDTLRLVCGKNRWRTGMRDFGALRGGRGSGVSKGGFLCGGGGRSQ